MKNMRAARNLLKKIILLADNFLDVDSKTKVFVLQLQKKKKKNFIYVERLKDVTLSLAAKKTSHFSL